ncbi:MAG: single-stranded DNA-binding protein [Prevotellaceae bacterium]|jgi:single-strand DNA-binding protein|nr:single-stranded DNA-binding protein [Prevotellaceae bacterium]
MLNKVMLIGNVGRDPEIRHLENGVAVVTLPIATTERYKDRNGDFKEQTEWHTVVFWRNLAEIVEKHVHKGSQVFIEGRLRTRSWEDQSGQKRFITEIVADTMRLLGRRADSQESRTVTAASTPEIVDTAGEHDDLPF